jgi:hypothetical protein
MDFGVGVVGKPGPIATFTVTNKGERVAGSLALTVLGPAFVLVDTTCTTALAAGQSCVATVVFRPTAPGPVSGTLSVRSLPGGNDLAGLRGTGLEPTDFALARPPPFDAIVNTTSSPTTIVVTNVGAVSTGPVTVALEGKDLADFIIAGGTCGPPLGPRAVCTVEVVFKPSAAGTRTADLRVEATPGGVARTPLAGNAHF